MEVKLESGRTLNVTPSSMATANEFKKAVMRAMQGINLMEDLAGAELAVATSDEAEAWFFKCCEKAVYEGVKVNKELFDDPKLGEKAREDYHAIFSEVVKANVAPFFKSRLSVLKGLLEMKVNSPESGSQPKTT